MRLSILKHILLFILASIVLVSCTEDIDTSNRYVFKDYTVSSYLQAHEEYSEYVKLLYKVPISSVSESTVGQLLSARGHYTCFAPTNEAIQNYLEQLAEKGLISEPSWDGFENQETLDSICKIIVMNSIIDGRDETWYETGGFPRESAEFELTNMRDRKLSVHYGANPDSIYINTTCPIDLNKRDINCLNGIIHQMHAVVVTNDQSMAQILKECMEGKHSDYRVMSMLIDACGLMDTLSKKRDEAYERAYLTGLVKDYPANGLQSTTDGTCYVPQHRKYGFTLFAEPDRLWEETLGKRASEISIEDVKNWIIDQGFYPEAKNDDRYKETDNVLNLFVTYHLLPMRIPNNKLVMHNNERGFRVGTGASITIPVMEHYTTMGKPRLLKIYQSYESRYESPGNDNSGIYLNRFPNLDDSRTGNYHELSCEKSKEGILIREFAENVGEFNTENGMIYPIEGILAYTNDVRNSLGSTRIRFEAMSMFPETMTNDIRQNSIISARTQNVAFPQDHVYKYLENLSINELTRTFCYFGAWGLNWNNYQGDEIKGVGQYDYTFKLPPVPRRTTYEIRYKVLANHDRGVCQIYFGTDPNNLPIAGIPMDLTMGGRERYLSDGTSPSIAGWIEDINDEDSNSEVDKSMRLNGFMKGPQYYWDGTITSREQHWNVRRIIVRQTLDPDKQYYLRFKSCIDSERKEFYMDYIEYCPKEVYDNPMKPEDIW